MAVDDTRAIEVVRGHLDADSVSGQDADAEPPHLPGDVPEHLVAVVELHPEHGVRERLDDLPLELDLFFLRQALSLRSSVRWWPADPSGSRPTRTPPWLPR